MVASVFSVACSLCAADRREGVLTAAGGGLRAIPGLRAPMTAAAAAALAGGPFSVNVEEEEQRKKRAATEKLRGVANVSPHISLMYRLVDNSSSSPHTAESLVNNCSAPDGGGLPDTRIVCRGDIFPTFCACTPFLVRIVDDLILLPRI